jgi:hypothetical protein
MSSKAKRESISLKKSQPEAKQSDQYLSKDVKNKLLKEQSLIENMEKCYIYPHEFLYLLCNT